MNKVKKQKLFFSSFFGTDSHNRESDMYRTPAPSPQASPTRQPPGAPKKDPIKHRIGMDVQSPPHGVRRALQLSVPDTVTDSGSAAMDTQEPNTPSSV